jgi:hypothetical protein
MPWRNSIRNTRPTTEAQRTQRKEEEYQDSRFKIKIENEFYFSLCSLCLCGDVFLWKIG